MTIKNITVLGSGIMGHGIAQVSAMSGYNVVLRDIEKQFLDKAMEKIKWSLDKLVSKQKITEEQGKEIFARITPIVDLAEALKDCDLMIEVVPEIMDLKKKVYAEVDKVVPEKTVFASNTSTLPITEIANTTSRPERFIGIHFFNPPQLMKLVEVIPGQKTSKDLVDTTINFVKSVSKEPVVCKRDVPGFIVNRLFIPLVHEAAYAMDRTGATKEEIDSAVKFLLHFPMGIFELADFTGMDVIHKATLEMHSRDKKVINPHPLIEKLYNEKKLGQKSGEGFYKYSG
ncbi:MAG: 3-hydroxyacyl-CoA dehydrogenase family protein, partial [Nitrosotalea sp.]